jgi:hypothetical protein
MLVDLASRLRKLMRSDGKEVSQATPLWVDLATLIAPAPSAGGVLRE